MKHFYKKIMHVHDHLFKWSILVLLFLSLPNVQAQDINVTGTVTDQADGLTLPGVTIYNRTTGGGAVTDIEGKYAISAAKGTTLVFSFVGYETKEVIVGAQSQLDIALGINVKELSEVVVVGYGSVEKKDVTGVVSVVKAEQFNQGIIGSPDKLLVGKVAGLQISSSGEPGASSDIRLRGASINGEGPLIVVDGVPLDQSDGTLGARNPLNFMNPNDVLNVTVLKDASAAAIYGSRGANGVIIITTKSGGEGKMKISYDGFYSISQLTREVGILSPELYRLAVYDKAPDRLDQLGEYNTDWVDEVTQVAQGTQHNVSVSGGNESGNYFASVGYLMNNGIMRKTSHEKTNLSLKLNKKLLNNSLSIGINSRAGFIKDQFSPNVLGDAMKFDPTRPVYDESNTRFGGYFQWNNSLAVANPVSAQNLNQQHGETIRVLNNLEITYKLPFVPGLSFTTLTGYNYTRGMYDSTVDSLAKSQVNANFLNGLNDEEVTKETKLLETYFKYDKQIGGSKLDITAGYSWQNFDQDEHKISLNYSSDNDGSYVSDTTWSPLENRLISFYGRANIDLLGKYLITGSIRQDGSTRFGESNKWGLFPSLALAWRIIEEDFASNWGFLSDLKLRFGYGVTGNQDIPDYRYNTFYQYSYFDAAYPFGNEYLLTIRPRGVDPNLKWEETISTNVGLDAGLFAGRLNLSMDYYVKNVNDLLFEIAVPAGSNLSDRVYTNIGQVQNKGIELTLDATAVARNDFRWNLAFNFATNQNEVVKLDNSAFDPAFAGYSVGDISGDVGQRIQVLKVGQPINAFLVYQHKRDENGNPIVGSQIEMYEDQLTLDTDNDGVFDAGDGIINEDDLVPFKRPTPAIMMGLTSNMYYKAFDLSFTIRANTGNYLYNNVSSGTGYFDLMTDQATNNIHQSAYETGFRRRQLHSDYYVEDASFVKLDNITLGYTFNKINFAQVKAYVTAQNVLTITGYSGIDPEVFNGIDNNLYPRPTTFIMGLNVNF